MLLNYALSITEPAKRILRFYSNVWHLSVLLAVYLFGECLAINFELINRFRLKWKAYPYFHLSIGNMEAESKEVKIVKKRTSLCGVPNLITF